MLSGSDCIKQLKIILSGNFCNYSLCSGGIQFLLVILDKSAEGGLKRKRKYGGRATKSSGTQGRVAEIPT